MAYEIKPNSGSLFRNENRRPDKTRDDGSVVKDAEYAGSAVIDGVEYFVDAWVNEAKTGKKYFGLRFKPKQPKAAPAPTKAADKPFVDDDISDIPF